MKQLSVQVKYNTHWGQSVYIAGSIKVLGKWNNDTALIMTYESGAIWKAKFAIPRDLETIHFKFLIKKDGEVVSEEYGSVHAVKLSSEDNDLRCIWQEEPEQKYFQTSFFSNQTSFFSNSIFKHKIKGEVLSSNSMLQLITTCIHVEHSEELVIIGSGNLLGNWEDTKAIALLPIDYGKWSISFNSEELNSLGEYKFAIRDINTQKIIEWESGENRIFRDEAFTGVRIVEKHYRKEWINWRGSGVAIPIFSLRSKRSFGIGEFSDLEQLVDWAASTKMKVIQVLPINDTTASYSWRDSYPYNAISIYALHPIYLGLHLYPLKDKKKNDKYILQAEKLNELFIIDYIEIIKLKTEYIEVLFEEIGESTLSTTSCQRFYKKNIHWLRPYSSFCYFRDKYGTANMGEWGEFSVYNEKQIEKYFLENKNAQATRDSVVFVQYLLHQQLTDAKNYAHQKGVVLKGDIPIGISPNSVEAWTEPHLFNLDCQIGAPPDAFSVNGQNWGFPTYNWEEMRKDNYSWWRKRFEKMADYFDAYRIDHILGFFRIWEIPATSVHGLLGYFSPALPLSHDEIHSKGIQFDEEKMATASIHEDDLVILFGKYTEEVKSLYLFPRDEEYYILDEKVDNQKKIQNLFHTKNSKKDNLIREGLYTICNEVLFVRDKNDMSKYHPRISFQKTMIFSRLDELSKQSLNLLYEDYFYHRHSEFWRKEALSKLPTLITATNMLVCGEDLGMVPESVPSVMNELQILSLEIQRMPKELGLSFSYLDRLPYLSVSTTSTHDMSPIRLWWQEDRESIQYYYNNRLHIEGDAPEECNREICTQIIREHLKSPSMLTIFPLQDWLSISNELRRDNPKEEKINEPSNPQHNWNYRMHITLEELFLAKDYCNLVRFLNEESNR